MCNCGPVTAPLDMFGDVVVDHVRPSHEGSPGYKIIIFLNCN